MSRAFIWVTRRILIALAKVAYVFCRFMSRQMEFDADRYEVHMTGSRQFRSTAVRLRVLGEGFRAAVCQAQQIWRDNQLPNDLPTLCVGHANALGDEATSRIEASIARRNVDVMDTHPPDAERIRAAETMDRPGVLEHSGPAHRLLHRCEELCRKTTFAWFRDQGYAFTADNLVSLDIVQTELRQQDEQFEALQRYLGGSLIDHRILPLPGIHKLIEKPEERLREVLRAWREPLGSQIMDTLEKRYLETFEQLVNLTAAQTLSRLHLPFEHQRFGATSAETAEILQQTSDVTDQYEGVRSKLGVQDSALAKRFAVSLALGCRDGLLELSDIDESLYALRALGQVCEHTVDIVGLERSLRSLIQLQDANPENPQIANAITDNLAEYQRWLDRVNNALIRVPNPLRPGTHLGEAVWQWTPDREYTDNNPQAAAQTLRGIVDALRFLNVRITGRLAEHAERVESTLGA